MAIGAAAMGVGVPQLHEDFASRLSSASSAGKGKQLAQSLEVLLVDEVSMLAAEFLDLLDEQVGWQHRVACTTPPSYSPALMLTLC